MPVRRSRNRSAKKKKGRDLAIAPYYPENTLYRQRLKGCLLATRQPLERNASDDGSHNRIAEKFHQIRFIS